MFFFRVLCMCNVYESCHTDNLSNLSNSFVVMSLLYFWLKVPWVLQYVIYDPTKTVETRTYGL